ncbi:histidine phosphatase family protein [Longispora sp. K20-0274]|uniref:histidine phosphatase family protein n=1 Tax=Longispora sp. K20-0274 TaxID=3088255 RepID=UPI0039998EF9
MCRRRWSRVGTGHARTGWLGVVRHGESVGNVAAFAAEAGGLELVDLTQRDADVGLSPTGRQQAEAVGGWLAALPGSQAPAHVVASPYARAGQTADIALAGCAVARRIDERLRDRELGVLDLLTSHDVRVRQPAEAARRQRLGKFSYRPAGGESWADVALRLRSLLADLRLGLGRRLAGHRATVPGSGVPARTCRRPRRQRLVRRHR